MKYQNLHYFFLISLLSICFVSCNDDNEDELVKPSIELDKNSVVAGILKTEEIIKLTTNGDWLVTDVPDWIAMNVTSGKNSTDINMVIEENREPETREAVLKFVRKELTELFTVRQVGLKDVISSPGFPMLRFSKTETILNSQGKQDIYNFETNNLFINPGIRDHIYLGNLVSHNLATNTAIPVFTGYTFNPITISTSAAISGEVVKTYIPSWEGQDSFAKQIIAKKPKQNQSFLTDNGVVEFYDYNRLYTLGICNLGIKLDELVSGSSYKDKEMTKKYGLIFSFKQVLFSLDMDIPDKVVKEELKAADKAKGVSYISSVGYGRVGMLVVESNTDSREFRVAVNNVIAGKSLSQKDSELINAVDACYIYFTNSNQVQVKKGKLDAINAYKDAIINETDNFYPVAFQVADFTTHALNTMSFSVGVSK